MRLKLEDTREPQHPFKEGLIVGIKIMILPCLLTLTSTLSVLAFSSYFHDSGRKTSDNGAERSPHSYSDSEGAFKQTTN